MGCGSEPTAYLAERIRIALAHDPRTHELGLLVSVAAGRVVVSGTVTSATRSRDVVTVVRELCPDLEIQDDLRVKAADAPPDSETVT